MNPNPAQPNQTETVATVACKRHGSRIGERCNVRIVACPSRIKEAAAVLEAPPAPVAMPLVERIKRAMAAIEEMRRDNPIVSDEDIAIVFYGKWQDAIAKPSPPFAYRGDTDIATEKASEPRIEQRWNAEGEEAMCIIWGDKIIGFGSGADGRKSCEDVLRRGDKLHYYSDCPDYILTKPAAPPADMTDTHSTELDVFLQQQNSRFAFELAMYLTRNNQQHTSTAQTLQAGIEQFLRDKGEVR